MYKLSMPLNVGTVTESNLGDYIRQAKKCRADRIFVCGMGTVYSKGSRIYTEYDKIDKIVKTLRGEGFEVGIWCGTLGNGHSLTIVGRTEEKFGFTQITGIKGEAKSTHSNCPLDEGFVAACQEAVKRIASLSPDLIMFDDDMRFYGRIGVRFPCFCPLHLKEYYERIGEEIPRERLEEAIMTGGENRYRTELLKLFHDTFIGFAKALRAAVDEVDPKIRLGQCTFETWDMMGTDPLEISKTLAGGTKPFVRISGAPFRDTNVVPIIEYSRQQYAWAKDMGIELFSEGDVYPRSRGHVPSRPLELFELIMKADGTSSGMLAYLFEYYSGPEYETKYVERFCRNAPIREALTEIFEGKDPIGVEVVNFPHKAECWQLPSDLEPKALEMVLEGVKPASPYLLSINTIPTAFSPQKDYPLLIIGENAKYVDLSRLSQGAILDIPAAQILAERGVDTGLISAVQENADKEYFERYGDGVGIFNPFKGEDPLYRIECREGADVRSSFLPSGAPASYRYENANGMRFYVISYDYHKSLITRKIKSFTAGYYRKAEIIDAVEWISGKPIPTVTNRSPNLYMLASKGEGAISVVLANVSLDDVIEPDVVLDGEYTKIRFINCDGRLSGNRVTLTDIAPYGICAFEAVKE